MFTRTLLPALLSALAAAQNLTGLPACAVDCLQAAIDAQTICAVDDQACQCSNEGKASIQSLATSCLLNDCSVEDLITAQQAGSDLCAAYSPSSAGSNGTYTGYTAPSNHSIYVTPATSSGPGIWSNATAVTAATVATDNDVSTSTLHLNSDSTTITSVVQVNPTPTRGGAASTSRISAAGGIPTAVANYAAVLGGFAVLLL